MAVKFQKLTRDGVRALQPGEKIHEHGIYAQRLASGDVRFGVNVMVDGQRVHRIVGRESDGVTRNQAEQLLEKLRTDARAERLDLPQGRKLHRTFGEAADDYLARMAEAGGKDLKNKTRHLRAHLVPYFRAHRLDQLSAFVLQKYRKVRIDAGASDATVNRELATFLHLMNRAVDWKWIKPDQKPRIPRVAEQRKARRALTTIERNSLMKGAMEDHDPRLWLFVALGLGTGMRHTEILRRRYDEIDWSASRFEIDKAKAGARLQPFPGWVREALVRQQAMEDDPNGWIFPALRTTLCGKPHRTAMDDGFRRAAKRAGLDPAKVTPHLMRHTVVTDLSRCVDVATIQKISGHKTAAMVMHYTHVNDERIDLALQSIDTAMPTPPGAGSHLSVVA
ncbi:MAG TPA: tyrosine-type recombinase/integrase [Allosphingosinicella sp.]